MPGDWGDEISAPHWLWKLRQGLVVESLSEGGGLLDLSDFFHWLEDWD